MLWNGMAMYCYWETWITKYENWRPHEDSMLMKPKVAFISVKYSLLCMYSNVHVYLWTQDPNLEENLSWRRKFTSLLFNCVLAICLAVLQVCFIIVLCMLLRHSAEGEFECPL